MSNVAPAPQTCELFLLFIFRKYVFFLKRCT
jgi:hypothetical protein